VAKTPKARQRPSGGAGNKSMLLYTGILDGIEKDFDLAASEASRDRLSSGLLVVDLISGGGLVPGMVTVSGPEASGKSTLTLTAIKSAMRSDIPIINHYDAEGTAQSDPDYAAACMGVASLREVYGEKINGVWRLPPRVRYWDTTILEKYFNSVVRTLNRIPDKMYSAERKRWYLRVARTGPDGKRQEKFLALGEADAKLSDKHFAWIPTDNPYPQALIVPDSYVTFLPEDVDTEEQATNAMAEQAREFAKHLRRIVGKFRRKQVVVFGVNQMRERPGVMYGPTTYEPAGNALKLYSSMRFAINARAVPQNWRQSGSKTSQYSEENSVEGNGADQYAYKHIRVIKNKTGTPWQEGWIRIWIKDRRGKGRGADPVFDTAQFLLMTGLAQVNRREIKFAKGDELPAFAGKRLTWDDFKALIIAEEYKSPAAVERAGKLSKGQKADMRLRRACFNLLRNGKALQLLSDQSASRHKGKGDDDLED